MKKIIAILMVLAMVFAFVACDKPEQPPVNESTDGNETTEPAGNGENEAPAVMSYAEFVAAELDEAVVVETYIQAKQGWWEKDGVGVATFYTQNEEGAYFIYEMPCTEEDYNNKLVAGAKIRVSGFKAAWAGEVEIIDASYEVLEGNYIAEAIDLTEKLGSEDLINYQNQFAVFKGVTISGIEFKNGQPGNDIYVTIMYNGENYSFCVESYLTGPDTQVYADVSALNPGAIVDIEGFVYWYEGINTHITSVTVVK